MLKQVEGPWGVTLELAEEAFGPAVEWSPGTKARVAAAPRCMFVLHDWGVGEGQDDDVGDE